VRSISVIYDKTKLVLTLSGHLRSGFRETRVAHVVQLQVIMV